MRCFRYVFAVAAPALLAHGAAYGQGAASAVRVTNTAPPLAALGMPVRGGALTIKVDDYATARQRVIDAARNQGAQVVDGSTDVTEKGRRHGWVRLRLASDRLPALLAEVRQTGKLCAERASTRELVGEYEDLERRVARLREHQARLDALLQSSRRLRGSDILYVQERLFRAGVDEGMLRQRRAEIERQARTSSVVVTLFEPVPVRTLDRARIDVANAYALARVHARYHLSRVVSRGVTGLTYAAVFAPLWLPLVLGACLLLRPLWRRRHAFRAFFTGAVGAARAQVRKRLAAPPVPAEGAGGPQKAGQGGNSG